MGQRCQRVTSTSVPIVKCILKHTILKTFHYKKYEIISWSKRQYDKAYQNVQYSIKIFLSWYIPKVLKSDFNIISYTKMYGKVWKQDFNRIFLMLPQ